MSGFAASGGPAAWGNTGKCQRGPAKGCPVVRARHGGGGGGGEGGAHREYKEVRGSRGSGYNEGGEASSTSLV